MISGCHPYFFEHCILIICRDERDALVRDFDNKCSGDLDIGIVTDHMMLSAREQESEV